MLKREGREEKPLAVPPVADLDGVKLIELANQPLRKRTTTPEQLNRIREARERCNAQGIGLMPGRTRRQRGSLESAILIDNKPSTGCWTSELKEVAG